MVSLTCILAMVTFVATIVDYVEAHGYIKDPPCSFIGIPENSGWVVEIPPPWKGDWDGCNSFECLLALFKKLGAANNYKDVRSLMDGNPLYGKDCGHTDPKAKAVPPPSNGQATFSRPVGHSGPCELWIENKKVFQSDDCQSSHPDGIFKPVDYSLCGSNSCILRFYWIALQRKGKNTVWQAYKNCINILGRSGGGGDNDVSQEELPGSSNVSQNNTASKSKDNPANKNELKKSDESKNSKKESNESKDLKKESKDSKKESKDSKDFKKESNESNESKDSKKESKDSSKESKKDSTQSPFAGDSPHTPPAGKTPESPSASLPGIPAMTPAPNSKCKDRRRRRY
ncbi:hypothetical protein DD237_008254 [Peronospora effusa]|uniref:Uncharacterized protein n=1 Tax=Peronospora effusa TaxID=542832 RepID=A0A3R7WV38_9STRA|nr:hypothetical protein DD237_008254 [Peronospora effusa]